MHRLLFIDELCCAQGKSEHAHYFVPSLWVRGLIPELYQEADAVL